MSPSKKLAPESRRLARAMKRVEASAAEMRRRFESVAGDVLGARNAVAESRKRVDDAVRGVQLFEDDVAAIRDNKLAAEDRLAWKIARAVKAEAAPAVPHRAEPAAAVEANKRTLALAPAPRREPNVGIIERRKQAYELIKPLVDSGMSRRAAARRMCPPGSKPSADATRRAARRYEAEIVGQWGKNSDK